MPRIVRKSPPQFSKLALAVCAALVVNHGYNDFLHLRYL